MADQNEVEERITRIREKATALFEDPEIADRWMCTRNRALGDAPINLLETVKGTEKVETVLHRIEHGVFS
ncbi:MULTISPECIES: MbcA/ParS/Xre antitoxin family protein [unclassified Thioalkalivibrio]|uniref:MbcA/ParS/Xre antitoxin family protein n=1 Tax=unclassified Thioalkalivibrio TaxID=2621013 RepID=UPI0003625C18|nr:MULTISPECIES: MbcA/ParS/Xre antitoxin family protein [unclassified Thioalkalivibrio]